MTGDTVSSGKNAWNDAKDADIMCVKYIYTGKLLLISCCVSVTTVRLTAFIIRGLTLNQGEKWDSLTRSWCE